MSKKKKWTKAPKAVEKVIRNVLVDDELISTIEEEIPKMKIVTPTIISGKYNLRVSIAKEIINMLENQGKLKLVEHNRRIRVYKPLVNNGENN